MSSPIIEEKTPKGYVFKINTVKGNMYYLIRKEKSSILTKTKQNHSTL